MKGYTTETASDGLQNDYRADENIVQNNTHKKRTYVYVVVPRECISNRNEFNMNGIGSSVA